MPACNRDRQDTFARDYYGALPFRLWGYMFAPIVVGLTWWLPRG